MLRDYQLELKASAYDALTKHRSVCVQLPTGGGKSVIIASICKDAIDAKRSVLVVVHRIELVEQMVEHLWRFGISASTDPHSFADVYVCMVQSLAKRKPPMVSLVIIDEAHHANASTYGLVIDNLPNAKILGFTATPSRLDGRGLGDVFQDLVVGPTVTRLMDMNFLVPSIVYSVPLDPTSIKTTAGDYNSKALSEYMKKEVLHGDLVNTYNQFTPSGRCIVYASSVELSVQYAREYNDAGISAGHIDGGTNKHERKKIIDDFRSGRIKVLSNCSLITEGFDVPDCDVVQLVRPTKSLAMYLQMVGRGLRPNDGKKECVILDHANCVKTHGFPDDERRWTLDSKKKKKNDIADIVEIDIGLEKRERKDITHLRHVQLVRAVKVVDPIVETLNDIVSQAEKRGYAKGWIYQSWREKFPVVQQHHLKHFAKMMGYNHQWVKYQKTELNTTNSKREQLS